MKYFIVSTTIKDSEYEYFSQSPTQAETEEEAIKLIAKDAQDWTENDYREFEIGQPVEITKEEFEVIKKYIY